MNFCLCKINGVFYLFKNCLFFVLLIGNKYENSKCNQSHRWQLVITECKYPIKDLEKDKRTKSPGRVVISIVISKYRINHRPDTNSYFVTSRVDPLFWILMFYFWTDWCHVTVEDEIWSECQNVYTFQIWGVANGFRDSS